MGTFQPPIHLFPNLHSLLPFSIVSFHSKRPKLLKFPWQLLDKLPVFYKITLKNSTFIWFQNFFFFDIFFSDFGEIGLEWAWGRGYFDFVHIYMGLFGVFRGAERVYDLVFGFCGVTMTLVGYFGWFGEGFEGCDGGWLNSHVSRDSFWLVWWYWALSFWRQGVKLVSWDWFFRL